MAPHRDFRARYGPAAVVAGASSGLGAEFARQLAERGLDLLLLARRRGAVTRRFEERVERAIWSGGAHRRRRPGFGRSITAVPPRRYRHVARSAYWSTTQRSPLIGPFLDQTLDDKLRVIDVNCRGPLILADELGRAMVARGRGGIVLMSSLAGGRGSPLVSTYAATKAFNTVLAEGLWQELGGRGVDVLACRAGATRTPNYEETISRRGACRPWSRPRSYAPRSTRSAARRA